MAVTYATVNNHLVARDATLTWRWYDAWGPTVTKWELNPNHIPLTSTTAVAGYTVTNVNGTLSFVAGADGGALQFNVTGADNDGIQLQPITEAFKFAAAWPCYFGIKLAASDVTQSDLFAGLAITTTTAATAVTDGIYFWSVDGSAACTFNTTKGSVSSSVSVATLVNATAVVLEWYSDGTNVTAYVDGVEAGSVACTSATYPNVEYLTPIIAWLTGAVATPTLTVTWARAIQIRETA